MTPESCKRDPAIPREVEYRTNLLQGQWQPLTGYAGPATNGDLMSHTDTNPPPPQKFYRIRITSPEPARPRIPGSDGAACGYNWNFRSTGQ